MRQEIDTNHDGLISLAEFTEMMKKNGIGDPKEVSTYFNAIDQDRTGIIKYSEFIAAAMAEKSFQSAESLEAAFRRLDLDDSGTITTANLRALMGNLFDESMIEAMIAEGDYRRNGSSRVLAQSPCSRAAVQSTVPRLPLLTSLLLPSNRRLHQARAWETPCPRRLLLYPKLMCC